MNKFAWSILGRVSWLLCVAALIVGCSRGMTAEDARTVLSTYYQAPDRTQHATGKQLQYELDLEAERRSGRTHKAFSWRVDSKSNVQVESVSEGRAIVVLYYQDSFTLKPSVMRFRLEYQDGRWLVADHTDFAGSWLAE